MRVLASLVAAATIALAPMAHAQSAAETEFVMSLYRSMNQLSIAFNREVCGHILVDDQGRYSTTKASWGGEASCASLPLDPSVRAVSSWHTHAAYGPAYDGEVPSTIDVEGDLSTGLNGWVSTPGGRLWFIDGQTGNMRQVCGLRCLPNDQTFLQDDQGPVAESYTIDGLYARFGQSRN